MPSVFPPSATEPLAPASEPMLALAPLIAEMSNVPPFTMTAPVVASDPVPPSASVPAEIVVVPV